MDLGCESSRGRALVSFPAPNRAPAQIMQGLEAGRRDAASLTVGVAVRTMPMRPRQRTFPGYPHANLKRENAFKLRARKREKRRGRAAMSAKISTSGRARDKN